MLGLYEKLCSLPTEGDKERGSERKKERGIAG